MAAGLPIRPQSPCQTRPTDAGDRGHLRFNGPDAANEITIDTICATVPELAAKEGETPEELRRDQ